MMYDFLSKYLMSEDDLVENGYPRPCPTSPGKAVIKTRKEQPSKDCKCTTRGFKMFWNRHQQLGGCDNAKLVFHKLIAMTRVTGNI